MQIAELRFLRSVECLAFGLDKMWWNGEDLDVFAIKNKNKPRMNTACRKKPQEKIVRKIFNYLPRRRRHLPLSKIAHWSRIDT
jgi:hypothetical protein